jgi:hypothetical protein
MTALGKLPGKLEQVLYSFQCDAKLSETVNSYKSSSNAPR